ncbi:MAG TPA: hypothetical protein VHS36_03270 [Candidatus Limnocylindrales bacterium]|nr:hypothetical protein [Candidatus Limnocylindrales bacterium]
MILRIVGGRIGRGRLEPVTEAYTTGYAPVAMGMDGLDHFVVGVRPLGNAHQLASMTIWLTVEAALAAYDGNLSAKRTLDGRDHGEQLTDVDYYEVEDAVVHRDGVEPAFLRLTAGSVARGLDADIQQELRRRLGRLPAELADGYIGRRVIGDGVEIAFMSTWSSGTDRAALEAPIWPEISSRYDAFRVDLYDVITSGAPGRI